MQKDQTTILDMFPFAIIFLCLAAVCTISNPLVFLLSSAGILMATLTVLFPHMLNCAFLFALALAPKYAGVKLSAALPDITLSRIMIAYYLFFSILLNRKTILENLKKQKPDALNLAIIFFLATNILVVLSHGNGPAFKKFIGVLIENIVLFYGVLLNIKDGRDARRCFDALLAAAVVIGIFGIAEFITGVNAFTSLGGIGDIESVIDTNSRLRMGYHRIYVTFSHPIALAEYVLMLLFPALGFFLEEKKSLKKSYYFMLVCLLTLTLLLTLSRAPIGCAAGGMLLFFIVIKKEQKIGLLKIFAVAAAALLLLIVSGEAPRFLTEGISSLFLSLTGQYVGDFSVRGGNIQPFDRRLSLIPLTLDIIKGNELLGAGLAYFGTHKYFAFNYQVDPYQKYQLLSIDNFYLFKIIEGGILGVLGYLAAFASVFALALKAVINKARGYSGSLPAQGFLVSVTAYFICLFSADELGTIKIFWVVSAVFAAWAGAENGAAQAVDQVKNLPREKR